MDACGHLVRRLDRWRTACRETLFEQLPPSRLLVTGGRWVMEPGGSPAPSNRRFCSQNGELLLTVYQLR